MDHEEVQSVTFVMPRIKTTKLDPCEYCDAFLDGTEKLVTVYRHRGSSHFILEHVPAQVCSRCGERYFSAMVVREMDRLMQEQSPHSPTVSVPVSSSLWALSQSKETDRD
jgi:YgiT-type zinc finger domain-containing protein